MSCYLLQVKCFEICALIWLEGFFQVKTRLDNDLNLTILKSMVACMSHTLTRNDFIQIYVCCNLLLEKINDFIHLCCLYLTP